MRAVDLKCYKLYLQFNNLTNMKCIKMIAIFILIFGLTLIEGNVQFKRMTFPSRYLTSTMIKQQSENVKGGIECASLCNAYSDRYNPSNYLFNTSWATLFCLGFLLLVLSLCLLVSMSLYLSLSLCLSPLSLSKLT